MTDVKSASLLSTLAATLIKIEPKTVAKTLGHVEVKALVDTFHDTISEVVAKNIADTLTCVVAKAPVKTADTLAGVKAYLCLGKLKDVEAEALVYTQAHTFSQVYAKSVTAILSDMEAETPVDTLSDVSRGNGRESGRHNGKSRGRGIC